MHYEYIMRPIAKLRYIMGTLCDLLLNQSALWVLWLHLCNLLLTNIKGIGIGIE